MTGYYEWQEALEDGKKVKNPSYDHAPGDELLLIAGLLASIRTGAAVSTGGMPGPHSSQTGSAPAPARHEG
ncbi:hypothetical protein C8N39_11290 [Dietzia psychralcaliphila]|nr:hypothetical protein C8N39_11290 [Dietzia psychralcaliphila]